MTFRHCRVCGEPMQTEDGFEFSFGLDQPGNMFCSVDCFIKWLED